MMELIIAIGLGSWFAVSIGVACVVLFKDFNNNVKEEDNT